MSKQMLAASIAILICHAACAADAAAAKPAAAPAAAAKAAPPAAPALPAELAQLAYFEGNWNCTGKAFASPMGPEHASTATVHAAKAVGDRWLHVSYDEKKTAANPVPYHVGVYMGYDASKKQFVEGCVDNFGGYCNEASSGWDGEKIVFEGAIFGDGPGQGRDTFTKKSADEFIHSGQMQGPDKQWIKTDEETCHKGK